MNKKNHLSKEKSPYLLQHKDNPVNWHSWGQEAFDAAIAEDKPIFLSIGYSTCYWCHVMEQDSFENDDVAKILNDSFISIKIDREERPDIDQIYMDAVVAMTGRGGWPLTAILTSDLKPFFGGTFFPKDQFTKLLTKISAMWRDEREGLIKSSNEITEALSNNRNPDKAFPLGEKIFDGFLEQTEGNYDKTYGGFGRAPKFPPTQALRMLLRIFHNNKNESAARMAVHTLDCMARGGIYDHIGGGFARYSVDEKWAIPHFEKMLYDNALLAMTYLEAGQVTNSKMFTSVACETLDYIIRDMQSDEGGYYSAQDAGDVGSEGEYYVWPERELEDILSDKEFTAMKESFNISAHGNFEDNFNVLIFDKQTEWQNKKEGALQSALEKLSKARQLRRSPHLDDKVLTSWNALTVSAMLKAYQVSKNDKYLKSATSCMEFIKSKLWNGKTLFRRYRDSESKFSGYLDDYAYLVQASLDFFETDGDATWLSFAMELQKVLDERFWDKENSGYFFTEEDGEVRIFRKKEFTDNSTPSGNGVSAHNLLRLYHLSYNEHFKTQASAVMSASSYFANQYPSALCSTLIALDFSISEPMELVVKASREKEFGSSLQDLLFENFIPNKVISWPKDEAEVDSLPHVAGQTVTGKTGDIGQGGTLFLCRNKTCLAPISNLEKAKKQILA